MAVQTKAQTNLDESGRTLLRLLVGLLVNVKPGNPRTYISYSQVHDRLHLPLLGPTFGKSLQNQGLNSLANWTYSTTKPGITGLIISNETLMPGDGYFNLFGKSPEDFKWWEEEIAKSKAFDWSSYIIDDTDPNSGKEWTAEELHASVEAYLKMQRVEHSGHGFSKKHYYEELAAKFGRTSKSFEFRMQNISYVLSLMGRDWLTGLRPAKNVGVNVAKQIETLIAEIEGKSIEPIVAFEIAVRENRNKQQLPKPAGNPNPIATTSSVTQYPRDPAVKAWVLNEAAGICESCRKPAPFSGVDGLPYLEVHHVHHLAAGGSDMIENTVAICPNCHRELHYGERSKELVEALYKNITRLSREWPRLVRTDFMSQPCV